MVRDYCSNPDIEEYHIKTHSNEWFQFRGAGIPNVYEGGIGASEGGKVCGQDEYSPCLAEVFHYKIGSEEPEKFDNERMLHGRISEQPIIDRSSIYDGTTESIIKNLEKYLELGRPKEMRVRDIVRIRSYIVNKKYPWLFSSLDALIPSGEHDLRDGVILDEVAPLEIKTIGEMASKQWIGGIPRKYVYQINQQMLCLDVKYGEIAVLKDGTYFEIHTFQRNDIICEEILTKSERFWKEKVIPGREAYRVMKEAQAMGNYKEAQRAEAFIQTLEPGPDGTKAYNQWKVKKVQKAIEGVDNAEMKGDILMYKEAREYAGIREVRKIIDKMGDQKKGELLRFMEQNKVKFLNFGESGKAQISAAGSVLVNLTVDLSKEAKDVVKLMDLKRFN